MLNDFRNRIAKAKNKKELDKILMQALKEYGLFSKEYAELLSLCWDRLDTF